MSELYVKRLIQESPTRLWVNNPLQQEATKSIEYEVIGATSNPTYVGKLYKLENTRQEVLDAIDLVIQTESDDRLVMEKVQQTLISKIAKIMLPVYEATDGERGFTAIQGNPNYDNNSDYMVEEALRNFDISPNIIVKIPATSAGLAAFRELTAMNRNIIVTSCLSIPQEEAFFKAYREIHQKDGNHPKLYVTSLAGIFDSFTKKYTAENRITLSEAALNEAGNHFSKLTYQNWKKNAYPGLLMGGGARNVSHLLEIVGGDLVSTINYEFIVQLNQLDLPVVSRVDMLSAPAVVDELNQKLPYYQIACTEGAMAPAAFDSYPPFVFFHNSFVEAWNAMMDVIASRR